MLNFCFCPRSAVWLASFGLQLLLETAPAEAARRLQAGIGLLSFRIPSREVLHFIENNHFRCWSRRYIDFFVNVPSKDFVVPPHCMTSLALIRLPGNFQQFFDFAWSKTSHGVNRFMHIPMRRSDFARFENTSEEDHWVSCELAVSMEVSFLPSQATGQGRHSAKSWGGGGGASAGLRSMRQLKFDVNGSNFTMKMAGLFDAWSLGL
ncbi:hypothetical protein AK812_SmicGene31658 [Symbiodinium microadriaticum]|uniref:Uncharacterized protein n=1 Tax=Symbiodinium microadriaticum TaxID=2951 RepID=A0A1Q9CW38_SYMMI|nr:hypothetical protein AK812_SmicGene31658 [Symbiodinium microadriaticum]